MVLVHFGQVIFDNGLHVGSRHEIESSQCTFDLASCVEQHFDDAPQRWVMLIIRSIGVALTDNTMYVFASLRYCMCIHYAFHKRRGSFLTGWSGWFRQRGLERPAFAPTSTVEWCSARSGSLSAVSRSNVVAWVGQRSSLVNCIRWFRVRSRKVTDLKDAGPGLS